MMRKSAGWPFGVILLALTLGSAAAQEKPKESPPPGGENSELRAFGTVSSVGVDRFDIKKIDGSSQTIMVDDQTKYQQGQQAIQLEDLKSGDRVAVRARVNANKEWVAVMVRRVTEKEARWFQNRGGRAFGEITSIANGQIKVQSPRQGERIIAINDQTVFVKDGQPITLKDLKVGDRIFAVGEEKNGQIVARRVMTGQFRREGREGPNPEH